MVRAATITTALTCAPLLIAGCRGDSAPGGQSPVAERSTLENGALMLSYAALPDTAEHVMVPELQIGALDGDAAFNFGDIRSIDAASDGTLFVLDAQASEIRAFDASGAYLATIATEGEGPGEVTKANGMILIGDSLLWIQDTGKRRMLGLTTDGTETHRIPMHVTSYQYFWNGTVDDSTRFWKPARTMDDFAYPPPDGLSTITGDRYIVSYDTRTEAVDSMLLGPLTSRQFVLRSGTSTMHFPIPFDPDPITIVDPAGGFWRADEVSYQVVRMNPTGDTTLVISVAASPLAVTAGDRQEYIAQMTTFDETMLATAEEILDLAPETKPQIIGLVLDENGNVWVKRGGAAAAAQYDVFTSDGDFITSVALDFPISEYLPPRIRGGNLYAMTTDDLDVQYVARAPLPPVLIR